MRLQTAKEQPGGPHAAAVQANSSRTPVVIDLAAVFGILAERQLNG
jgi:hypothetical protein